MPVLALAACKSPTPTVDSDSDPPPIVEPHAYPVFEPTALGRTAFTVSVELVDGEPYYAVEHAVGVLGRPDVELVGPPGSATVSSQRLLPLTGHYPAMAVEGDALLVVTKQSVDQNRPHLEVWTQAADLVAPAERESLEPAATGYRAGRPALATDPVREEAHLCWTANYTEAEQDVFIKSRPSGTAWADVEPTLLAGGDGSIEDHCDIAFTADATRWSVYHSDRNGDRIFVRPDPLGGELWGVGAPVALPQPGDQTGGNFPAIDAEDETVLIAAAGDEDDRDTLSVWRCTGTCRQGADWTAEEVDPEGDRHNQPKALLARGHRFLLYRTERPTGSTIDLSVQCGDDTEWTHHGALPRPEGWDGAGDLSTIPASAVRAVRFDPESDLLHGAYLVQVGNRYDVAGWTASVGAYCP